MGYTLATDGVNTHKPPGLLQNSLPEASFACSGSTSANHAFTKNSIRIDTFHLCALVSQHPDITEGLLTVVIRTMSVVCNTRKRCCQGLQEHALL